MTNKEKFLALVSDEKTGTIERNGERIKSRAMLRESQKIAIKVLAKLDELGWSQKDLAREMDVSPQQITKIVSGKENLTIETQIRLQDILDIPILASYYESRVGEKAELVLTLEKRVDRVETQPILFVSKYQETKVIKMESYNYLQDSNNPLAI